jgi:homoserine dehydrogenase
MKQTTVGIIGWGTVGSGAIKILLEDRELIVQKLGWPVVLKKVADLDLTSPRPVRPDPSQLTQDAWEIINDPEIDIVVELIGGYEPAKTFILAAIAAGKHIVTANKALLAVHGREIFEAAARNGVDVLFEASVGGGIPIIRSLKEGLAANHINYFFGILNGTSNYILTKMTEEGMEFGQALKEAQDQGFAEADPSFDVEGIDAAHKLAILVALAYGYRVDFNDIYVEGISRLDPLDISFAAEFGYEVKLLAISSKQGNLVEARLHPAMVPKGHLLTEVRGPFNAIHINGHAVGDLLFYGSGAGMMPTASAIVGDIMELARSTNSGAPGRVPALAWSEVSGNGMTLKAMEEVVTTYYFRFSAVDRPGVLSKIAGVLGAHGISIGAVIQKGREIHGAVPIVMLTHEAKEAHVRAALAEMDGLGVLCDQTVLIRVEARLG